MALEHSRLLAASLGAALLGSCSTSNDGIGNSAAQPDPNASDEATLGSESSVLGDASAETQGGQDPKPSLDQQRRQALVERYLELAERLRGDNKLDAALAELLKAKELSPENEKVLNLIMAVQAERGVAPGGAVDYHRQMSQQQQIAEERARAYVTDKLQRAQAEISALNYATAVDELRQAKMTIQYQNNVDWMQLEGRVVQMLADAEARLAEQQRERASDLNERMAAQLREEYQRQQAQRRARVNTYLKQAQEAFESTQFARARDFALKALDADPSNGLAQEFVQAATKAARDQSTETYYTSKAKEIRQLLESREELKIPYTQVLMQDQDTWDRAQLRASARRADPIAMDPQDTAVLEQVQTAPVGRRTFTADTGGYLDVVQNLQLAVPEIPIIVTPQARTVIDDEALAMEIELVNSITLANFLDLMVQKSENLAWTVRNGYVVLGDKSEASGTIVSRVHPVKDLVFQRTQFLPPKVRDIPGGDGGFDETPRTGGEGDEKIAYIDIADLVQNIQDATDPGYWGGDGVEITPEDSGILVVKASPDMQRRIERVLDDMRRFASPVVTIDSKFLTVSRNFLQEVGVDFRGLGGSGNKGTAATLDDVTNGLQNNASRGLDNGGTGDPAANPLAGMFFNDGGDGDARGRTENYFNSSLGRNLTTNGGLTASWTLIDDTQFNMVLQAIEKQEDAEVVNSQILSVLDRERGHVAVIDQQAYVRDVDVEVAQASFIADPKIDVIQDGIVLDVRPVIEQNRKYIILNLNPTVAELTRPIPTFTTSLAGSTLPVTLQLPRLDVTSFATTARVPDGGTVLLGGLRQILSKERRAEVPVLANLPLVSFFFKQEGQVDENRNLMVMVRAWITDVKDLEGK